MGIFIYIKKVQPDNLNGWPDLKVTDILISTAVNTKLPLIFYIKYLFVWCSRLYYRQFLFTIVGYIHDNYMNNKIYNWHFSYLFLYLPLFVNMYYTFY